MVEQYFPNDEQRSRALVLRAMFLVNFTDGPSRLIDKNAPVAYRHDGVWTCISPNLPVELDQELARKEDGDQHVDFR